MQAICTQESHKSHCTALWFFATALLHTKQGNCTTIRLCWVKTYKPWQYKRLHKLNIHLQIIIIIIMIIIIIIIKIEKIYIYLSKCWIWVCIQLPETIHKNSCKFSNVLLWISMWLYTTIEQLVCTIKLSLSKDLYFSWSIFILISNF